MISSPQLVFVVALILTAASVGAVAAGEEPVVDNTAVRDTCAPSAADAMTPIGLGEVRIAGEIGRRLDITANNNLLALDVDNVFLAPFRESNQESGPKINLKLFQTYLKDLKITVI